MTPLSDAALGRLREVADRPDLAGTRYEYLRPLGKGGMGAVHLVRDQELQREVALKVLNDPEPDGAGAARLLAEARVIAGLEHPGIVPVYDAGTLPDGRVYYTMKRVSGARLDAAIPPRSREERLRLFLRVCEPVAFAHAHGILHRDLKPSNVMVGAFGEVLVMDWGMVAGTPGFRSPEQEAGAALDPRSDVHALGALLRAILEAPLPGPLESICRKATAAAPGERYAGVPDLADDVGRFLAEGRVLAHRETPLERGARFARRYQTPIALIAAYLLMRLGFFMASR